LKNELIGKGFTELREYESIHISGGSIFSTLMDGVVNTVSELTGHGTPVSNLFYLGVGIIEWVARPIYQLLGLKYR
jgi:hypothetical protein